MTKEFSLIEAENEYILNKPNFVRRRPGFYPSSASVEYIDQGHKVVRGICLRSAYYDAFPDIYIPKQTSIYLHQTGLLGKSAEQIIINRWKEMGLYVANNFKFYDRDLVVSGEGDVVLKNPEAGHNMGIEVKTYYSMKAERNLKGLKRDPITGRAFPGKPKDYQFLQSLIYAWEYRDVLPEYRMYYLERGNGNRFEFEVGLDRNDPTKPCWWRQLPGANWNMFDEKPQMQLFSVNDVHNRYKKLLQYCKDREVPPKDYSTNMPAEDIEYLAQHGEIGSTDYKNWKKDPVKNPISHFWCNYCNHKDQCQQDE